ncbi:MAG: hypothetical protein HYX89_06715 [Chloroflexi bacterium]|nr:hypothetical protein [Chloroflexota bacterium]
MDIDFVIIADAVEAVNGKLYMLGGGWNQWKSRSYPSQTRMGIAAGILVQWEETNLKFPFSLSFLDEENQPLLQVAAGDFEMGRPPGLPAGTVQRALLAVNVGFPLQRSGRYTLRLAVDDRLTKEVIFDAILA